MVTGLDTLETPVGQGECSSSQEKTPDGTPPSTAFIHSSWQPTRTRILNSLHRTNQPNHRLEAFTSCGSGYWLFRHKEDRSQWKLALDLCHDRFCIPCQAARANTIRRNLMPRLSGKTLRFITLTLRADSASLSDRIKRLLRAFRRARSAALWRERVTGGVAFLEVTRNVDTGSWNPHLHIITEGSYLPKDQLSQLWLKCTGDSRIVDIRIVKDPRKVGSYVTKYVTKAFDAKIAKTPAAIDELVLAMKGQRTVIPFGTWYKWRLLAKPDDDTWTLVAHSNELEVRGPNATDEAVAAWTYARTLKDWHLGLDFTLDTS